MQVVSSCSNGGQTALDDVVVYGSNFVGRDDNPFVSIIFMVFMSPIKLLSTCNRFSMCACVCIYWKLLALLEILMECFPGTFYSGRHSWGTHRAF